MAIRAAGHHIIGTATPGEDPVAVGYLWSDTANNLLKLCTSISPYTFSALSGGSGAPTDAEYLVAATNGDLSAERVPTTTATISWDFATAAQAKANVVDGSITYAKIQDVSATDKLLGRSTAGSGDVEEIACTAAGRALLDDAAASNQRTTLGLGTIATQDANAVSISGGSVTGITDLAIADGGTGQSTATAAFDALAPTTTQGDLIYHNGTDNVRLAKGTASQFLKMNSGATAPEWGTSVFQTLHNGSDSGGYNPVDASTYYTGMWAIFDVDSSYATHRMKAMKACTIVGVRVATVVAGTPGTAGNTTFYIRVNDTTDTTLGTQAWTASVISEWEAPGDFTAVALAAGDYYAIKWVTPTWATNPTTVFHAFQLWYTVP